VAATDGSDAGSDSDDGDLASAEDDLSAVPDSEDSGDEDLESLLPDEDVADDDLDALLDVDTETSDDEDLGALLAEDDTADGEEAEDELTDLGALADEDEEASDEVDPASGDETSDDTDLDSLLEDQGDSDEKALLPDDDTDDSSEAETEDDLDALVDDGEASSDETSEDEDLGALLGEEDPAEGDETSDDTDLDSLLEDQSDGDDDLDALLTDDDAVEGDEATDDSAEADSEDDLDALVETDDETSDDEDLGTLLTDDDTAEGDGKDASGDLDEADADLDALAETDDETSDEASEEADSSADLDALAETEDETSDEASEEADSSDDLDALAETDDETSGDEDLGAMLTDDDTTEGDGEEASGDLDEADADLDALVETDDETSDDTTSDDQDLDALLADDSEVDNAAGEEEEASGDLGEEDSDDDLNALMDAGDETSDDDSLDALFDADSSEESDLDALLATDNESSDDDDLDALLEDEETDELDGLLGDLDEDDSIPSLGELNDDEEDAGDLDSILEDLEEEEELAIHPESSADDEDLDDIDSLLDDLEPESEEKDVDDLDSLLDDLEPEAMNVGVEEDVAHMLAGKEAPEELVDDHILDDFKSVQASILTEEESDRPPATVLIVDLETENRQLLEDSLSARTEFSYTFEEAEGGLDAEEAVRSENIDLVLLNLDGDDDTEAFDFLEQVASSPDLPTIPVIVNSTENDRIERAMSAGASDYFLLPLEVMDVEYQVPTKVATHLKLHKSLAGVAVSASRPASDDISDLDDLLEDDDGPSPEDLVSGVAGRRRGRRAVPVSDPTRLRRERELVRSRRHEKSRAPLFAVIGLLLALLVGTGYVTTKLMMEVKQRETVTATTFRPRPMPVLMPPTVTRRDYQLVSQTVLRPDPPQQDANVAKIRIRQAVDQLEENGQAWWSPWRVLQASGATVDGLVNRRRVSDILEAFDATVATVEEALSSTRTLDYLARVGFDLRGKTAQDLNARETFELLSTQKISGKEKIVNVLSSLRDKLARDRAAQAKDRKRRRKASGTAMMKRQDPGTWMVASAGEARHPSFQASSHLSDSPSGLSLSGSQMTKRGPPTRSAPT